MSERLSSHLSKHPGKMEKMSSHLDIFSRTMVSDPPLTPMASATLPHPICMIAHDIHARYER
jgi:hypothetical protein